MKYLKLYLYALVVVSSAVAKQDDWKDIFTLLPFFENDYRLSPEPIYTGNQNSVAHFVDNLQKRQDNNVVDPFQRIKMTQRKCSGCCCKPSYYKPKNIRLGGPDDIFLTVMEVSDCSGTCRSFQMCKKEASTVSWSRRGLPDNNTTMIYTSCSCVP